MKEIEREQQRRSLPEFIDGAWEVLEPSTPYLPNWHIQAISEHLEAVTAGDITRLIINIPPRYMKSLQASVMWPVWSWIDRPHLRWMFASYSSSLSTKHSVDRRTLIQSDWYQRAWGDRFELSSDQNVKTEFSNTARGHMIATSMAGTSTGKGGDIVVIDDPLNPEEAYSDIERDNANRRFDQTLSTRLNDKRTGAIVIIMQRLHEDDLTGHVLTQSPGEWTHLCLPAVAEEKETITLPVSKMKIEREQGDILWPAREGPEEIEKARRNLGSYGFAGQYQQSPSPAEGGILKRQWWRYWYPADMPAPTPVKVRLPDGELVECAQTQLPYTIDQFHRFFGYQLQSWDLAFKDTEASDYVVGQVWAGHGADKFLLDQRRDRLEFNETVHAVRALSDKWPHAVAKLIEDKANGPAVIAVLQHELAGIIPIEPHGSKVARARAVSPTLESGNVYIPHPAFAAWVDGFVDECAAFDRGAHDDQTDAFSQAVLRMLDLYDETEGDLEEAEAVAISDY